VISRIRLLKPVFIEDPKHIHEILQKVEAGMGGAWVCDCIVVDRGWRVYGFLRYTYTPATLESLNLGMPHP